MENAVERGFLIVQASSTCLEEASRSKIGCLERNMQPMQDEASQCHCHSCAFFPLLFTYYPQKSENLGVLHQTKLPPILLLLKTGTQKVETNRVLSNPKWGIGEVRTQPGLAAPLGEVVVPPDSYSLQTHFLQNTGRNTAVHRMWTANWR